VFELQLLAFWLKGCLCGFGFYLLAIFSTLDFSLVNFELLDTHKSQTNLSELAFLGFSSFLKSQISDYSKASSTAGLYIAI